VTRLRSSYLLGVKEPFASSPLGGHRPPSTLASELHLLFVLPCTGDGGEPERRGNLFPSVCRGLRLQPLPLCRKNPCYPLPTAKGAPQQGGYVVQVCKGARPTALAAALFFTCWCACTNDLKTADRN